MPYIPLIAIVNKSVYDMPGNRQRSFCVVLHILISRLNSESFPKCPEKRKLCPVFQKELNRSRGGRLRGGG